jgi:diguanylate cyclase (GGDEF)-like protein/PAS domain S-box-containing protein
LQENLLNWQYVYLTILFLAAAISLGIAYYAWLNRSRPGLLLFAGMMLSVAEYTLTAGLMSSARTTEGAVSWVHLHYLGLTVMLAFFITFVIQFSGHAKWLNQYTVTIVVAVPVITQIIIETNPLHHWFIQEIQFRQDGILMGLEQIRYGAFFWFHTIYGYVLVLCGMALIIELSVRTFKLYRVQSLTLFAAVLVPLLGSINDSKVFMAGIPYPIVPICFTLMGILIAWNMFRNQMLNIIPVARDTLVESMHDSLIVLNTMGQIIDINPAALKILHIEANQAIGKAVEEVLSPWQGQLKALHEKAEGDGEICIIQDKTRHFFDIQMSPLKDRRSKLNGHIIVLHDITKRVLAEIRAQEALEDIRNLQEQLYKHSIHDALTGLYNRRYLDEIIPRELANATRSKSPISLVMMDIDHFKKINDTYGHATGDQVLQNISVILKEQTRIGDMLFRYGGEEFLALLINTGASAAYEYAERWRQALENYCLNNKGADIRITMSMGVAEFNRDGNTIEAVMQAADAALYQAKDHGRNCVTIYHAKSK